MHIHTAAFRALSLAYIDSSVVALRIEAIGEGGLRHHAVLLCEERKGSNSFGEFGFLSWGSESTKYPITQKKGEEVLL